MIRDIHEVQLLRNPGGRVVQREAVCDLCGASTGIQPARKLTFQKAQDWIKAHHALNHRGNK